MIEEAVQHYHELLQDEQLAADTAAQLAEMQKARNLYFGSRPLCTVLRPFFYAAEQWNYLKRETEILLGAFARAHEACLHDSTLRAQLALERYEETLFHVDARVRVPWSTSRLDSFFTADSKDLHYVEYNAETPAGMGYEDVLAQAFSELEVMKRFGKKYAATPMLMLNDLLDSLLQAYKDWGGTETPNIGIIDWGDVPTLTEHEICKQAFEARGIKAKLADPRALQFRGGGLWADDFRIHIVYKRVLLSELIERMGIDNPIVRAVRERAALMTNSFSAKLMAKKASFAFLSDERNSHLFTGQQLSVIHAHIPWTRVVTERKTVYEGRVIELLPFLKHNRADFVLKPNDEYGGKGVVLGWDADDAAWDGALRQALNTPFVVQKRVHIGQRDFPAFVDGGVRIDPRYVDADPYVFYGRTVHGCLTRLSSVALLNVTAGAGSVVPTFVIEEK